MPAFLTRSNLKWYNWAHRSPSRKPIEHLSAGLPALTPGK